MSRILVVLGLLALSWAGITLATLGVARLMDRPTCSDVCELELTP